MNTRTILHESSKRLFLNPTTINLTSHKRKLNIRTIEI